jgi:hypothetical protein
MIIIISVGFEVFTAVVLKSIFFWDMTPCSALSATRRFGGTYRLHLQGCRIVSEAASKQVASGACPQKTGIDREQMGGGGVVELSTYWPVWTG